MQNIQLDIPLYTPLYIMGEYRGHVESLIEVFIRVTQVNLGVSAGSFLTL